MENPEEEIICTSKDDESAITEYLGAQPQENPVLGNSWRYKVAFFALETRAHVWTRASEQPPKTRLTGFSMLQSEGINGLLNVFEGRAESRGVF